MLTRVLNPMDEVDRAVLEYIQCGTPLNFRSEFGAHQALELTRAERERINEWARREEEHARRILARLRQKPSRWERFLRWMFGA